MIRWRVLLTVCALTLGGYVPALSQPACAPTPGTPNSTTCHYPTFSIGFPGNFNGSIISGMALTITQDPADSNNTLWALAFHTQNNNWDTDRGMWQGRLIVRFWTQDNAPVPMPAPTGPDDLENIYGWRDACYYGDSGNKKYQGGWKKPYTDFIGLVHHIIPLAIWHRSAIGQC